MATFLDFVHLRRQAVPVRSVDDLARHIGQAHAGAPAPRRRLVAVWHLGEGTRPVCAWSETTAEPELTPRRSNEATSARAVLRPPILVRGLTCSTST